MQITRWFETYRSFHSNSPTSRNTLKNPTVWSVDLSHW